jgi:hypothetical protein
MRIKNLHTTLGSVGRNKGLQGDLCTGILIRFHRIEHVALTAFLSPPIEDAPQFQHPTI